MGWATQAPGTGLVIGSGKALVTAIAYSLYLSGYWTPDCRVARVGWLPGNHS